MEHRENLRERDLEIDLENGGMTLIHEEDSKKSPDSGTKKNLKCLLNTVYGRFIDASIKGDEENVAPCSNSADSKNGVLSEKSDNKSRGEKIRDKEKRRKSLSNKKAPKPPRPPRGPSLDAADQKLIREIAELAMLKRARIERMRATKKMKSAKASSSSGNIFATLLTVLFCVVIIFQGMSPKAASAGSQGARTSTGRAEGSMISVQYVGNPSASEPNGANFGSPNLIERVSGRDTEERLKRVSQ